MPGSNVKLPKVTQYVRNVGRSVAFASINAVKDNMEGIKGFAEDNEDVFVEIYSGVKNYRETLKKTERSIKDSSLFKAIEYGAKNLVEDAKTGNFYNDRTSDISESALGLDDDSLGLNFDYEVSSESSSQASSGRFIADTFSDAMKSSTIGTTTAVAKGTDMVVRSTKASTTILSTQIERSTATIHSGLGAVYNSVNQINQFLNGPMMAHLENSRTYYDNSLKLMQEQHAMMKEMLEMQRNLYSVQAKQYSTSRLDQSMSANGMMNLRGYSKTVKSNLNNILSMYGLDMLGGNSGINMPMLLAAAPFKIIMDVMFDSLMPKNIKKNLKSFDSIMSGVFGQFIGKMNKNKNDFTSNGFINLLGEIFGIEIDNKKSINTSKYNKGAVAFDGITRKTIVEVIPGYLARIEAALTGSGERHFDPHSGKWKTARQIESDFEKERISSIESANRRVTYDLAYDKRFQSKSYQRSIQKFKERIYEDGYFDAGLTYNPFSRTDSKGRRMRSSAENAYKKYGFKDKKTFDAFLSMLSDETIAGLAASNLRAKQDRARRMQEYEDTGSVFNILFNDTYNDGSKRPGTYSSPSKFTTGGLLNRSTDKYGNNVFYYLREILKGINSRWRPSKSSAPSVKGSTRVTVRKSHSRESSTPSSESEDDSGSDDDDNSVWDSVNADFEEEERREAEKRAKKSAINSWVSDKLAKSPLGKFFAGAINGVSKVFSSPLKFVNDMLEKANNNMFSIMFGDMKLEVNGKKVDSVFQFIIEQVKSKFDEIGKYVKNIFNPLLDKFKNWFAPKWDKYGKPVIGQLKNYGTRARNRIVTGLDNTIGRAFDTATAAIDDRMDDYNEARDFASAAHNATGDRARIIQKAMYDRKMTKDQWKKYYSAIRKARRGEVSSASEVAGTASAEDINNPGIITQNAFGTRYVTKRGLTMISPGEMIIPASDNPVVLNKMLSREKQDKNKILNSIRAMSSKDISLNAKGTIDTSQLRFTLGNIWNENTGENSAKIGAGGILGLGAGLITGFNPFLAALAGAGLSVLDNSDTLKNIVFGEVADEKTGDRKGGLISKKIQDTFKKYAPDMGDFGIAGGVLGLLTPFGPFMGAAIGAGIGFLKNSESFKKFIFGNEGEDDGLISKKAYDAFKEKIKKAAPKMLLGAGAGILAGPFGLLGNAAIGAGIGLISSTETFQNFLYGEADENGERHGGVVDAFKTGFLEPAKEKFLEFAIDLKEYSKKHIIEPMKDFWKPVNQMLKNVIHSVGDGIKDHINDMFERTVGLPLHDFLQEKLFKPISKVVFGILKAPYNLAKGLLSLPFSAARGVGNTITASQIRRGTAYNMTANERIAWRQQHGIRFNKFNSWKDKTLAEDEFYAGIGWDKDGIDRLQSMVDLSKAGLSSHASLQQDVGKARKAVGAEVSKFFNTETKDGRNRFNKVGHREVTKLAEIAQTKSLAEANEFIDKMRNLTDDEKDELKNKIAEKVQAAERANKNLATFKTGSDKIDQQLSQLLGKTVKGRKDRRKIMRSAEAELKARKKIAERANESDETKAIRDSSELALKKADCIISTLKSIDLSMKELAFGGVKSTKPTGSVNNNANTSTDDTTSTVDNNKSTEMTQALELSRMKEQKAKKTSALGNVWGRIKGLLGFGGSYADEDSKEAKEAEAAENAKHELTKRDVEADEHQVSILTKIKEALVGKKDTEDTGFLGKMWKGLGTFGKWLGIGGLALTGASLFGHLTQWFKTSVWPNLKTLMFGNGDDNSDGVIGRFTYGIRNYLFGDGTEENKGLFGNTKDALSSWWDEKASPWLETKINNISTWFESEGGFTGIFTNRIMPAFIKGLGYTINNLLGPAIAALLRAAPSLLGGLGKALWQGITDAFINRGVGKSRSTITIDDGGASAEFNNLIATANSTIEASDSTGTVTGLKGAFGNLMSSFRGTGSSTVNLGTDTSASNINDKKSNGIRGLFGQTTRTNNVEFDENGNVVTDYTRLNTTDSLASYVANAAGRNFIKGLGGAKVATKAAKKIGKDILTASGNVAKSGILSKVKGAFGFAKSAVKTGSNVIGSAGKFGSKINNVIDDAAKSMNYQGKFLASTKGIVNAVDDTATSKGILKGITKIFKNIIDNNTIISKIVNAAKALTGKEVTEKIVKEAIEKIGTKLGKTLVGKAAGAALKGIGNIIAKFSPITIATFVADFIWGFDNADTILGVAKGDEYDINLGHKCICGLVNMLTNFFTLGLLPTDVIMDICIEFLFPIFGLDTSSIQAARDRAQSIMDEWNKANPDDTYNNLQDFNNKDKWWFKAKKGVSNWFDNTKNSVSNTFKSVSTTIKNIANNPEESIKSIKDGTADALKSVSNVIKGQYSIFSSQYWASNNTDDDDTMGILSKLSSTVIKVISAPHAMVGYVGSKIWKGFKDLISSAKEGAIDASSDILAVAKGQYTIFSSNYWKSNVAESDNPLSVLGNVFGFITRLVEAPRAMLGYTVSKVWQGFKSLINGANEGILDASSDVNAVKSGKYTIFDKNYWKSDNTNTENSISILGNIFGVVNRILQAPSAMFGWAISKVKSTFDSMINGAKSSSSNTEEVLKKAEDGEISVFSNEYWRITTDNDNPLSLLDNVSGFMQRLLNAPIVMIKGVLSDIANSDIVNFIKDRFGIGKGRDSYNSGGTSGRARAGSGHMYQSSGALSNIPYGDSTIGASGCAPVAAANLLNNVGKGTESVKEAARYAERNGMTVPGGGTDIEFFNSYLNSKGISTRNTSSRSSVMNALANGNQVIMLGQDDYNVGAPFGTNPHFITAKGISKNGNIIIEDPDLPYGNIEYNPDDVMNSMISSVIAGRSRRRRSRILSGGAVHYYNTTGSAIGTTPTTNTYTLNANAIINIAKSQLGVMEVGGTSNQVIYNRVYYGSNVKGSAYPWCAVFVWWVFNQAGANSLVTKSAACDGHLNYFKSKGRFDKNPRVGDLIFFRTSACKAGRQSNHVGIVINITDSSIITIEGNTSGGMVKSNTYSRNNSTILGYGHPAYPYTYSSSGVIDMSKYGDYTDYKSIATSGGSTQTVSSTYIPDNSSDDTSTTSNTIPDTNTSRSTNLLSAIGNLGKNLVRKMYGDSAYNALFGDGEISTTTVNNRSSDSNSSSSGITNTSSVNLGTSSAESYTTKDIWNALRNKGYSKAGTAGIMGNMYAESLYKTNNLQNTYSKKWGLSDEEYTNAVNSGSYSKDKFVNDKGGYGLVQFTHSSLKKGLYEQTIERGRRIDSMQGQIDSIASYLSANRSGLHNYLKTTTDINTAADRFLTEYERPANMNSKKPQRRAFAQTAYNTYGSGRAPGYYGNGGATRALNTVRSGRGGNTVITTQANVPGIDYITFLKTIIEILISISKNTALLNRILEILSSKFGINIDANQVTDVTNNNTTAQAQRALNRLINSNADSSSMTKLINNKDTQYLLNAMVAIAGE